MEHFNVKLYELGLCRLTAWKTTILKAHKLFHGLKSIITLKKITIATNTLRLKALVYFYGCQGNLSLIF